MNFPPFGPSLHLSYLAPNWRMASACAVHVAASAATYPKHFLLILKHIFATNK